MTTTIAIRITPADIGPADLGDVEGGLGEIMGLVGDHFIRDLRDDHPAVLAWDALLSEAKGELEPTVRSLVVEAIHKRLPFTWEADNPAVSDAD